MPKTIYTIMKNGKACAQVEASTKLVARIIGALRDNNNNPQALLTPEVFATYQVLDQEPENDETEEMDFEYAGRTFILEVDRELIMMN